MIVFDVGANNGNSTLHFSEEGASVYAFEPVPELIDKLKQATKNLKNYTIVQKAVSDFNGKATFNVAGLGDWGSGSLFEFSDNIGDFWKYRNDLKVTKKIEIEVTTMAKFIEENNIKRVDYLHCDAQGADLKVLKSFGKHLKKLKAGMVEASSGKETSTCKIDNTLDSILEFLTKNGFIITTILSNDTLENEVNVGFVRI